MRHKAFNVITELFGCASHYVQCLEAWQAASPTQAVLSPHEDTEILI